MLLLDCGKSCHFSALWIFKYQFVYYIVPTPVTSDVNNWKFLVVTMLMIFILTDFKQISSVNNSNLSMSKMFESS